MRRAIAFESKILIMDEPTAALGVTEAGKLLSLIRSLRDRGLAILLITQRIPMSWRLPIASLY